MFNRAIVAAVKAGSEILKIYDQDFEVEFKADESPLTSADKAAHEIIVQALEQTPYPVLSEESAEITYEERKNWTTYWLVDPLDGTKEFIKKNGEFTVNIALIENEVPTFGVVYVPVLDTLYCGMLEVGCGTGSVEREMPAWKAIKCGEKSAAEIIKSAVPLSSSNFPHPTSHLPPPTSDLSPPSTSHLPQSASHLQPPTTRSEAPLRVVASKSHCNDETREFIADLERTYGATEMVSRGSSLKLCMVAEGSADIYPRIAPTMEWDTAAAHAVVKAAGGEVFEYDSAVPATSYLCGKLEVEGRKNGESPPTSHLPLPTNHTLRPLRYNKENLLNPYFVVAGSRELVANSG